MKARNFPVRVRIELGALLAKRVLLIFDVRFDGFKRCTAAGDDEVARGPEVFAPELLEDFWQFVLADEVRRGAF